MSASVLFFDVNLLFALNSPDIAGIIAGPSKVAQWRYTLESYDNLRNDADELYRQILTIKAEFDGSIASYMILLLLAVGYLAFTQPFICINTAPGFVL